MPAVAGTARPPPAREGQYEVEHATSGVRARVAPLSTSLQHARPPHTLCLGGSLNILLAAPECMVKGR